MRGMGLVGRDRQLVDLWATGGGRFRPHTQTRHPHPTRLTFPQEALAVQDGHAVCHQQAGLEEVPKGECHWFVCGCGCVVWLASCLLLEFLRGGAPAAPAPSAAPAPGAGAACGCNDAVWELW